MTGDGPSPISVLLVDDEEDLADPAAAHLEREYPGMAVDVVDGAGAGLDALETGEYDCVVSDYDMPGTDGLEFLEAVRGDDPDLPFVLFTGAGSEEIASEAISAGVTDYLQRGEGTEQYAVLATRIENAVERRRAERRLGEERRRYELLGRASTDAFWVWDVEADTVERNEGYARLFGYDEEEIGDDHAWARERIHPEDSEAAVEAIEGTIERGEEFYEAAYRFRNVDGTYSHVLARGHVDFEDGEPVQLVGAVTDLTALRRREEELEAVRSKLELVLDGTDTGVWEWYPGPDRLEWDDTVDRLLGVPEGFDGTYQSFRERIHEADLGLVERGIGSVLGGADRFSEEFRVRRVDGEFRWVAAEGIARAGDDGEVERLVGLLRDVTDRKEQEARLRRSERRFRAVFEDPAVFMVLLAPDGTVERANDMALASLDVEASAVAGRPLTETGWWDNLDPAGREEVEAGIERAAAGEFVRLDGLTIETRGEKLTADGHVRPVTDRDGDVAAVLLEGIDVSYREERERRIEAIHRATRDLVRADGPEGVAAVVAEAAEEILDAPSNVVRLVDGDRLRPVTISERALDELGERPTYDLDEGMPGRALQRGEPVLVEDFEDLEEFDLTPVPNRSGLYVPIGEHGVLSLGDTVPEAFDRTDVHLAGILSSNAAGVLDRLEGERSLRERERQLARQNERLEEFAGVVAHDLRNPLNVATLAAESLPDDAAGIGPLENALDRMETLVDDVLELAKQGQAVDDPEPVDLGEAADRAWSTTDTAGGDLRVEGSPTVEADPVRLQALLENLFRNAIEHGGDGAGADASGDVPAEAEEVLTRGSSETTGALETGEVAVRVGATEDGFFVEDDGPGIPADDRDRIFETGYSTRDDGTGFGLAIVAEVADAHGWRVEAVEGREGGARVEITGVDTPASDGIDDR